jgi:transcriptional regulator with GAF, ATPase, and Fis domain
VGLLYELGVATAPDVDLTRDLRELVELATSDETIDELLDRGLEWMSRVAPYDLATVLELRGGRLVVRAARGPLASHELLGRELRLTDLPGLDRTLASRRAHSFTESEHVHEGDPFDGVLDFAPGHACMVVPLCVGDACFGVATLDRAVCEPYPQSLVDLIEVYGHVLAMAVRYADQKLTLQRLHSRDRERIALLEGGYDDSLTLFLESRSRKMQDVVRAAERVARADTPVLLLGETGTGKERLARAIHHLSPRAEHPFVALNCAAIPAGLLESELFGHVKGAFTGATRDRVGRFQVANGGTLLLDEIGELPFELQAKLLRVVQEGRFEPVGSDRPVRVDVRILAATHVDLTRAIAEHRFREDLYYRLAVFPLRVPALRDRMEDLELACSVLLRELARRTGSGVLQLTPAGLAKLRRHPWPGNLRELANVLERASIISHSGELGPEDLDLPEVSREAAAATPPALAARTLADGPLAVGGAAPERVPTLEELEREHVLHVLNLTRGRVYGRGGAAELLGLKPSTLQSRMRKLGVERRVVVEASPAAPQASASTLAPPGR